MSTLSVFEPWCCEASGGEGRGGLKERGEREQRGEQQLREMKVNLAGKARPWHISVPPNYPDMGLADPPLQGLCAMHHVQR